MKWKMPKNEGVGGGGGLYFSFSSILSPLSRSQIYNCLLFTTVQLWLSIVKSSYSQLFESR
jgi:hypothetical protein